LLDHYYGSKLRAAQGGADERRDAVTFRIERVAQET